MNRIISLFLFIFIASCLNGQYNSPIRNKVTLGKQTTADGLVYRGLAADTTRKPSVDTMAFILLDTNTNIIWHYKKATNNAWTRLNLRQSDTTSFNYVNTYGTQTVNGAKTFTSVINSNLENASFLNSNGTTGFMRVQMVNTGGNLVFGIANSTGEAPFATSAYASYFVSRNDRDIAFGTNDLIRMTLKNNGRLGLGITAPTEVFHLSGNARISSLAGSGDRTVIASATGVLSAPVSSITTKENVQILNYGLNEILQINPVSFDYIDKNKWGEERKLGFIVEDIFPIIPEVTGTMNDGDLYLDMVKLIPILTKAIQEQNLLIKALEQRLLILENK